MEKVLTTEQLVSQEQKFLKIGALCARRVKKRASHLLMHYLMAEDLCQEMTLVGVVVLCWG